MKNEVITLELDDKKFPDDAGLTLWIGNHSDGKQDIEFSIIGDVNGLGETLYCTLSKEDALKLANTLLDAIKD